MLLKPWQNPQTDLKSLLQTWPDAFHKFTSTTSERTCFIISGIRYFHNCETAAKGSRNEEEVFVEGEGVLEVEQGLSVEGLANLIASQTPLQEENHGHLAVEIAKCAKIFASDISRWMVKENSTVGNATGGDLVNLAAWKAQMKHNVLVQNRDMDISQDSEDSSMGTVEPLTINSDAELWG